MKENSKLDTATVRNKKIKKGNKIEIKEKL
jgi:hypothetical protein